MRGRSSLGLLLLGTAFAGSAAVAGCQAIAGLTGNYSLEPMADGGTHEDAGGGHDAGGNDAGSTGCQSAEPPGPPAETDGGGTISFVAAMHTVDMGDMGDTPGYDLDHACTCIDDGGASCLSPKQHCDAPGGVDNAAAALFMLLGLASSNVNFHSANLDTAVNEGKFTLLIQVENYNGEPDDFSVNVNIFPSEGLGKAPLWDGTDMWPVEPSSVGDGGVGDPTYTSQGAYVSGGVLVAGLPNVGIVFGGGDTFNVGLVGGILTGKLVKTGSQWKITNGIIAGRWTTQAMFQAIADFRVSGQPLCTDNPLFPEVKTAICEGADILANASSPPTLPCDSISLGIGFTADPAQIGGIGVATMVDGGCPPSTDPSGTTCP